MKTREPKEFSELLLRSIGALQNDLQLIELLLCIFIAFFLSLKAKKQSLRQSKEESFISLK